MPKFPNHLREFRTKAELSQPDLARLADTNVQNVSRIERGERRLTQEWAERFARHLKVTARELMFPEPRELEYVPLETEWTPDPDSDGEGYDGENYRPKIDGAIPELDAKAGAGEGAVGEVVVLPMMGGTKSGHRVIDEWRIPPDYLREAVRDPERAIVLPIAGDSMLPNYAPGDRVVIDLTEHELRVDGVYLISDGVSPPQIKRLQRLQFTNPPRCRIISDNPIYPATEIEVDLVHIMGKVSAYVGRR